MTSTATRQADFANAWADLYERVTTASDTVYNLAAQHAGSDNAEMVRLIDKSEGLFAATDILDDIMMASDDDPDYAAMWRAFTDKATTLLNSDGQEPGFYEGVHTALTYQRGYGPDIDAPVIPNPHA